MASDLVERCTAQDWRRPLQGHDGAPHERPVVALGKFDALHRGHRALAAAAAGLGGSPLLLSFSGMADVLGWARRLPLVAPCDRSRVLALWAEQLGLDPGRGSTQGPGDGGAAPETLGAQPVVGADGPQPPRRAVRQRYVPFASIRRLPPEEFVALVARDLRAAGVVAGVNYRFGYKAAGDIDMLQRLAAEHGLCCTAVGLVNLDAAGDGSSGSSGTGSSGGGTGCSGVGSGSSSSSSISSSGGVGSDSSIMAPGVPVSSSRIRELLAAGDVAGVAALMDRPYRLVAAVRYGQPAPASAAAAAAASQQHWPGQGEALSGSCSSGGEDGLSSVDSGWSAGSDASGPGAGGVFSTSSMDGSDSEVTPLLLRDGGRTALAAPEGLLNAAPGPGRYSAALSVYPGATPADELLHLEAACSAPAPGPADGPRPAGTGGGSGPGSSGGGAGGGSGAGDATREASGPACFALPSVEVQLGRDGLLLPAEPLLRAMAQGVAGGGQGPSWGQGGQALVVLDFRCRLG